MPFGPTDILWIGIIPCALAALVMWIASRLALRPTAAWTLSIATGLFLGLVAQNLRVGSSIALDKLLHPRVALDWLPWLVLVAAAIQLVAAYASRDWQRWLLTLAGVFAIAVPLRLLAGSVYVIQRWTAAEKLGVLVIWAMAFSALWVTFSLARQNSLPLLRSALLAVVALGIAVTLAASGALTLGELAGVAAATLFGTVGVAWATGNLADGPAHAAGPLAVMLLGLVLIGYFYSQLALSGVVLLAISLSAAAGWLPEAWPAQQMPRALLRTLLALIPLATAALSAVSSATATANPYG